MLEARSPNSLLKWGFFNSIFEQKEYVENYVMEKMAREMLKNNPKLQEEFNEKIRTDSDFAENSYEMMNWFYSKTAYWDEKLNVYPVGKIY